MTKPILKRIASRETEYELADGKSEANGPQRQTQRQEEGETLRHLNCLATLRH